MSYPMPEVGWITLPKSIHVIFAASDDDACRNIMSLQEWAVSQGVKFAPGISLERNERQDEDDWGVSVLESTKSGTTAVTVPSDVVLSSSSFPAEHPEASNLVIRSLTNDGMEEYVPEFFLVMKLLTERSKGRSSRWDDWIRTLPVKYRTGLYMDETERSRAMEFAPDFLSNQDIQWTSFRNAARSLENHHPSLFNALSLHDETILLWGFSVIFTRSWRSKEDNSVCTIVPIGDMFNHHGTLSNVRVTSQDDSKDVRIVLTEDANRGASLCLNYGITQLPARFLIIFGFADESSPEIFANIMFDDSAHFKEAEEMGFTAYNRCVFRTSDGAVSNTARNAVLYKVLLATHPGDARTFYNAHVHGDLRTMIALHFKWRSEVSLALRDHVENMLQVLYRPVVLTQRDNVTYLPLPLIARHVAWMRQILRRVVKHADDLP